MGKEDRRLPADSADAGVAAFLRKVAQTPAPRPADRTGRLIFALDATASREPTWDMACQIQGQMFAETAAIGHLAVQLVYYRGFGEFKRTDWSTNAQALIRRMTAVRCLGGRTQIEKVLRQAINETQARKVQALVFVGDAMEEDVDQLCHLAGKLGLLGTPAFLFQEGDNPIARRAFEQIAKLSNGAYCRFDQGSASQLRDLLSAVAVYAVGGRPALEAYGRKAGATVLRLTQQVR